MEDHCGPIVLDDGILQAIACEKCGYVHLDPLPTQDELDHHWREIYAGDEYLYEQELIQQWYWRAVYRERLREFDRLIPKPRDFVRILDFGAGQGYFTSVARACGWLAFGYEPMALEPSQWVFDYLPTSYFFEAAHCSLVLEHILDPLAALERIYNLLLPGGILCIIVPNEFNPLQKRLQKWGYSPLHFSHVNYFTPHSLQTLAKKAWFETVRQTATFPIEVLALAGLNYVRWPRLGIVAHWLRMVFEFRLMKVAPGIRREMRARWADRGVGREIELWVRKLRLS